MSRRRSHHRTRRTHGRRPRLSGAVILVAVIYVIAHHYAGAGLARVLAGLTLVFAAGAILGMPYLRSPIGWRRR